MRKRKRRNRNRDSINVRAFAFADRDRIRGSERDFFLRPWNMQEGDPFAVSLANLEMEKKGATHK